MLYGQGPMERERNLFYRNVELYKKGDYGAAAQNFQIIVDRLPNSRFLTSNYLMLTKTEYKLGNYSESFDLAQNFLKQFPNSRYRSEILNTMGNCYYQQHQYKNAAFYWTNAVEEAYSAQQMQRVRKKIRDILGYKLSEKEIESLLDTFPSSDGKMMLHIAIARQHIQSGDYSTANGLLSQALAASPQSRFANEAQTLKKQLESDQADKIRFALLLPLSGMYGDIGREIKEGVEMGIQEYNAHNNIIIELVIRDYRHDLFSAVRELRSLASDQTVVAVLGPLDNLSAIVCATIADYEKLPVMSPTATRNNLTQIGDYFFQLNIPLDIQAETLAQYAVDSLKLNRFATLAPIDNEGHYTLLVEKFSEAVERNGGKIVTSEWYYPEEQDYSKQLMRIKRMGLKYAFMDSVSMDDSLLTLDQIDSLYALKIKSDRAYLIENSIQLDSADIPLTSIDGLFVPIYNEDLQAIVSHIAQKNIQTNLLGNSDWDDPEQLKKVRRFIDGLVYVKDGYTDDNSLAYRDFRNNFRIRMKKTPTTYHLIGYDTMRYMLEVLGNFSQPITRSIYFERLHKQRYYDGLYRDIELNNDGSNSQIKLLKYQYGKVYLINNTKQ
jgi:branched-chain amino acid transport system substrate-binding protein